MQDQMRNGEEEITRRPSQNQQLRPDGHKVCERVAHALHQALLSAHYVRMNSNKRRKCFGGETETEKEERRGTDVQEAVNSALYGSWLLRA